LKFEIITWRKKRKKEKEKEKTQVMYTSIVKHKAQVLG
jgi:hypothetical protein